MPRFNALWNFKRFFKKPSNSDVLMERDDDGTFVIKAQTTEDTGLDLNLHQHFGYGRNRLTLRSLEESGEGGSLNRTGLNSLSFRPELDFQHLVTGETATAVFHATAFHFRGWWKWQRVDVRFEIEVKGINDAVEIDTEASGLIGRIDEGDDADLSVDGEIRFVDPDVNDTHTFYFEPQGAEYVGRLELKKSQSGVLEWRFSAELSEIDHLQDGDILRQSYAVTIDDGNGAQDTTTVTVTVVGGNDGPTVNGETSDLSGTVSELPDASAGEGEADLKASGNLVFSDVDLGDSHDVRVIARSDSYLGALSLGSVVPLLGTTQSSVVWDFVVNDAELEDLESGDQIVQFYDVIITDSRGATAQETVAITLNGADDPVNRAPLVTADSVRSTGGQVTVNLLANDIDPDGDTLGAAFRAVTPADRDGDGYVATLINVVSGRFGQSVVLTVSNGSYSADVTLSSDYNGNIQVNPGAGFADLPANKLIQFQVEYGVYDQLVTTPSTLNIALERINNDPIVVNQNAEVLENQLLEIELTDLLSDALDPDGDTLSVTEVFATGGTVELQGGRLVYTQAEDAEDLAKNETRVETVTYTVSDGKGGSTTGAIEVTIVGADESPVVDINADGFVLQGAQGDIASGGLVASAGDVNGDGFDDLIVGGLQDEAVYLVYGKADESPVDLAQVREGIGGFLLAEGAENIRHVSAAGDVNGDGLADIIVGRPEEAPNGADTTIIDWDNDLTLGEFDNDDLGISSDLARTFDLRTSSYGRVVPEDTRTGQAVVVFGKTDTAAIDLDAVAAGSGGFAINGYEFISGIGFAVSGAGDLNGDGLEDLIVGATNAQAKEYGHFLQSTTTSTGSAGSTLYRRQYENDRDVSGRTYVVFGKEDTEAVELEAIDQGSSEGFAFYGLREDRVGWNVTSLGDVNGDGFDDVLVSASARPRDTQNGTTSGSEDGHAHAYVLFGGDNLTNMAAHSEYGPYNLPSQWVAVADRSINSDQVQMTTAMNQLVRAAAVSPEFSLLTDGPNSHLELLDVMMSLPQWNTLSEAEQEGIVRLTTEQYFGQYGAPVSYATVNFDGLTESTPYVGYLNLSSIPNLVRNDFEGGSLVALDGPSFTLLLPGTPYNISSLDDLRWFFHTLDPIVGDDADRGFAITGLQTEDWNKHDEISGVGDINGDGLADMLITLTDEEETLVAFGRPDAENVALNDLRAGIGGYSVNGTLSEARGAGDVNGDGLDDFIAASYGGEAAYVIYGKSDTSTINLSDLDLGIGGFRIDVTGASYLTVSGAGDVNGDGFADVMVGVPFVQGALDDPGQSYVVFGGDTSGMAQIGSQNDDNLGGSQIADVLIGGLGNDTLDGQGGEDVLRGGAGNDLLAIDDLNLRDIDGGAGFDTLRFDFSNSTFEGAFFSTTKLQDVEQFDLGGNANHLVLGRLDVVNMSDTTNTLRVIGTDGVDSVTLNGPGWADVGMLTDQGTQFHLYANGGARVEVQAGLSLDLRSSLSLKDVVDGVEDRAVLLTSTEDTTGSRVAMADLNGDGFADVATLTPDFDGAGAQRGVINVVAGSADLAGSVPRVIDDMLLLRIEDIPEGPNGLVNQIDNAGDVNGDGIEDLIYSTASDAFVVFGSKDFSTTVSHSDIAAGIGGYRLSGLGYNGEVHGLGDVNGDGLGDLLLQSQTGGIVAFGKADATAQNLSDLASTSNAAGFEISSSDFFGAVGLSFDAAGDLNGDGFRDIVVASPFTGSAGTTGFSGSVAVVFGGADATNVDLNALLQGSGDDGIVILGDPSRGPIDGVAGGGDFNGDGYDDIAIEASGDQFVFFGSSNAGSSDLLSLAGGNGGFLVYDTGAGIAEAETVFVGDINGDGRDDLAFRAIYNSDRVENGGSYIVYGQQTAPDVNLLDIEAGINGFVVTDEAAKSLAGAGDINGDGLDDIVLGVTDFDDVNLTGGTFLIFG